MIAKSVKKYIFYINPAIVFNGDRARFVKEIRIKEEEKQREADLKALMKDWIDMLKKPNPTGNFSLFPVPGFIILKPLAYSGVCSYYFAVSVNIRHLLLQ